MVKLVERSGIFDNLTDNSVIVQHVQCNGVINTNVATQITSKFPKWFSDYRGYCFLFTDGHEDEILGTFHVFNVKPGLIICSAFTSLGNKYGRFKVDENALLKVLRKIERQVKYYNEHYGKNQTVHFPYSFTTVELLTENGEQRTVKEYVDMVFGESPVEVYIHKAN